MDIIEDYILVNIHRRITVQDIAAFMNMSTKQINRIIHHCYQVTPTQFISHVKVNKAKELLKNPQLTLNYVADALGFCNEYYFNRLFKTIEGMPPGKYRDSVKADEDSNK